jgi:hypothetical protein
MKFDVLLTGGVDVRRGTGRLLDRWDKSLSIKVIDIITDVQKAKAARGGKGPRFARESAPDHEQPTASPAQ